MDIPIFPFTLNAFKHSVALTAKYLKALEKRERMVKVSWTRKALSNISVLSTAMWIISFKIVFTMNCRLLVCLFVNSFTPGHVKTKNNYNHELILFYRTLFQENVFCPTQRFLFVIQSHFEKGWLFTGTYKVFIWQRSGKNLNFVSVKKQNNNWINHVRRENSVQGLTMVGKTLKFGVLSKARKYVLYSGKYITI